MNESRNETRSDQRATRHCAAFLLSLFPRPSWLRRTSTRRLRWNPVRWTTVRWIAVRWTTVRWIAVLALMMQAPVMQAGQAQDPTSGHAAWPGDASGLPWAGAVPSPYATPSSHLDAGAPPIGRADAERNALTVRRDALHERLRTQMTVMYQLALRPAIPVAGGPDALDAHMQHRTQLRRLIALGVAALKHLDARIGALNREAKAHMGVNPLDTWPPSSPPSMNDAYPGMEGSSAYGDDAFSSFASDDNPDRNAEQGFADPLGDDGRAAGLAASMQGSVRVYPERDGSSDAPPGYTADATASFPALRGRLSSPLEDASVTERRDNNGTMWLASRPEAIVFAVAEGKVSFAGPHEGYGNAVMLTHGDGYVSLYGGLGDIDVFVGDAVRDGDNLGVLPRSNPKLAFEIRKGSEALRAADWLGL